MKDDDLLTPFIEDVIQLRPDYFAFSKIKDALTFMLYFIIDPFEGTRYTYIPLEFIQIIDELGDSLPWEYGGAPEKGVKGIHGTYPIHGALYKVAETSDRDNRLSLLGHIVYSAFLWWEDIEAYYQGQSLSSNEKLRLNTTIYREHLKNACRVVRLLDAERLNQLQPESSDVLQVLSTCERVRTNDTQHNDDYLGQLERFFSYALAHRLPRRGYSSEQEKETGHLLPISHQPMDTDPDAPNPELMTTTSFTSPSADYKTLSVQGLTHTEEELPCRLIKSDQPIAILNGDSAIQAIFRSRAQKQHIDKSAQLLTARWECLSTYDLSCLASYDFINHKYRQYFFFTFLMILITGRSLESVLEARVVKDKEAFPTTAIDEQSIYLTKDFCWWSTGIIRPLGARKTSEQWRHNMRTTHNNIILQAPPIIKYHFNHPDRSVINNVKEKSIAAFPSRIKSILKDEFKPWLTSINRHTGSRLTAHRLAMHLFNTLSSGAGDLTAACLITGRTPSFGQQASLYYFAPSQDYLYQRYSDAIRFIYYQFLGRDRQFSSTKAKNSLTVQTPDRTNHFGSKIVPLEGYVKRLVNHMQNRLRPLQSDKSLFEMSVDFHNRYTAYTIAMLMFSTGYRCIRDPLPEWRQVSLKRGIIVIADKTDDVQSHARFLPLPAIVIQQLHHYQRHREAILSRLSLFFQQQWATPFFFLNAYDAPREATPKVLEEHLAWPGSPPLNINRHFLHTYLKESGCSSEIVDAFMGHWDAGQEPWADFSTFCPNSYREQIGSAIETMMSDQGWKAIEGAVL